MLRLLAVLLAASLISACNCSSSSTLAPGALRVLQPDGAVVSARAVDFGAVALGVHSTQRVTLRNVGRSTLELRSTVTGAARAFTFTGATRLAALSDVEVAFTFAPDAPAPFVASLAFTSDDGGAVLLSLVGRGVAPACAAPAQLDFGKVAVGVTRTLGFTLRNDSALASTATVAQVPGTQGVFTRTQPSADTQPFPSGASLSFEVRFAPVAPGAVLASLPVRAGEGCPEVQVPLVGEGVDGALRASPNPVEFGFVAVGSSVERGLTLENATPAELAVQLSGDAAAFSSEASVTVPAFGAVLVPLTFAPAAAGLVEGTLTLRSGLTRTVALRGHGGGPRIEVQPARLDFGVIAYFAGAGNPQTRRLAVRNLGTRATTLLAEHLFLGAADGSGKRGAPYARVEGASGAVTISAAPLAYDPAVGLSGGDAVELEVTLTPQATGPIAATLVLPSSDPAAPEVRVPVTASAEVLPPCNLTVSPGALEFGLLASQAAVPRAVVFTNTSATDACLLTDVHLRSGSDAAFSLPQGEVARKQLDPGERWALEVRAQPRAAATLTTVAGALVFSAASPNPQLVQRELPLSAQLGTSCLLVGPSSVDFGGLQPGCRSAEQTLYLYNVCSTPVTVTGLRISDGAGVLGGQALLCPGPAACPEFLLGTAPTFPQTLAPNGAPLTFTARYRPVDVGADLGQLAVVTTVAGQAVEQPVALRGTGLGAGLATDTFAGPAQVDILFSIDSSCSMQDDQLALASNLASFFAQVPPNLDYHLGVIDGAPFTLGGFGVPGPLAGLLLSGPGHPDKVLTRSTPGVEAQFRNKVNVGTRGDSYEFCIDNVVRALSRPLVFGANAGFLRDDAQLAVVCITDESDWSPRTTDAIYASLVDIKGGRASSLSVNAVASAPTCNNGLGAGPLIEELVARTGGVSEEICATDWATSLSRIGRTAFGGTGRFHLRSTPDVQARAIQVSVNGVLTPPRNANAQPVWEYDAATNAVRFFPLFIPQPGERVEVSYQAVCQ